MTQIEKGLPSKKLRKGVHGRHIVQRKVETVNGVDYEMELHATKGWRSRRLS